jgi:hypothetical protein
LLQLSGDSLTQASACGSRAAGEGGESGGRGDGIPLNTEGGSEDDVVEALLGVKLKELGDSLCRLHA